MSDLSLTVSMYPFYLFLPSNFEVKSVELWKMRQSLKQNTISKFKIDLFNKNM